MFSAALLLSVTFTSDALLSGETAAESVD